MIPAQCKHISQSHTHPGSLRGSWRGARFVFFSMDRGELILPETGALQSDRSDFSSFFEFVWSLLPLATQVEKLIQWHDGVFPAGSAGGRCFHLSLCLCYTLCNIYKLMFFLLFFMTGGHVTVLLMHDINRNPHDILLPNSACALTMTPFLAATSRPGAVQPYCPIQPCSVRAFKEDAEACQSRNTSSINPGLLGWSGLWLHP